MKISTLALLFCFLNCVCVAGHAAEGQSKSSVVEFGPYLAVAMNRSVVKDVKVDKEGNVFLQLMPQHRKKELVVKISNEYFDSYRSWWNGQLELVSPANAGRAEYAWTDRVQTESNYVEYWMDGEVFLHLKRRDRGL